MYTYRYNHESSSVSTFLCEGCYRRFPAAHLYGRGGRGGSWSIPHHLDRGRWRGTSNAPSRVYRMVCSYDCLMRVPWRTYTAWLEHFGPESEESTTP